MDSEAKCDFECNKDEPLIVWHNSSTGHDWVFHKSCLIDQLEVLEQIELDEELEEIDNKEGEGE